jgi:hypothetical protein
MVANRLSSANMSSNYLLVYPNPGEGKFKITNFGSLLSDKECEVFDGIGQKVYFKSFSEFDSEISIDLGTQRAGIYLLHLKKEGDTILKTKIIKNK